MKKGLTILCLLFAAGIFASCGGGEKIGGQGLTISSPESTGEDLEIEGGNDNADDDENDVRNGVQSTETPGKVFDLKDMMFDVHQWLPQLQEEEVSGSNADARGEVVKLFKPECHMYNQVNVCLEGADVVLENKFTLGSIIGLIDHAGMYSSGIFRREDVSRRYRTCSVGNDHAELLNHTAIFDPPDSVEFVIDFHDLLDCVASFSYEGKKSYTLYSKSPDGNIYASLNTRKQHQGTEWYTGVMSDIFQSYARTDADGKMLMLAYNGASFDAKDSGDWGQRAMVIVDMQTKRVAAKVMGIMGRGIVLVGGVIGDGEGYYMVKTGSLENGEFYFCVKGYGEGSSFADESECGKLEGMDRFFESDNWPAGELYEWLGLDDEDAANISGFDSFFSNSNFLSMDMTPQDGVDYFPDSISR